MTTAAVHHAPAHGHGHDDIHGETMPSTVGLPNLKLIMWLFLVTEVMFFAGLIGSYIVLRFGTRGWPDPYDILAVRITALNTFILICSSVTMVLAFQWSDRGDRTKAFKFLIGTILIGSVFVGIQVYEYIELFRPPNESIRAHVEKVMRQRGLPVDGAAATGVPDVGLPARLPHVGLEAQPPPRRLTAPTPVILLASTTAQQDLTQRQDEQLIRLHSVLAQGRPVPQSQAPADLAPRQAWDREVLTETIRLAELFPGDRTIRKYGKHHNLYPSGFRPGEDVFTSTFYIMTGFHGAHVAGGVVALIVIAVFYLIRRAGTMAIEVTGLYWHFVDLVWIILFTIVYLM